jgi:hypothetical protein
MTVLPTTVTDEMVGELDAELGHDGLVELTYAIAVENHRARFNHALGITEQGFTSGEACLVRAQRGRSRPSNSLGTTDTANGRCASKTSSPTARTTSWYRPSVSSSRTSRSGTSGSRTQ